MSLSSGMPVVNLGLRQWWQCACGFLESQGYRVIFSYLRPFSPCGRWSAALTIAAPAEL